MGNIADFSVGRNVALIAPLAALQIFLLLLILPSEFLNGDVAWFVMVAEGVVFGDKSLYVDYIEPNAPLASLFMTPAVILQRIADISIADATNIWVLLVVLISFSLTISLTRRLYRTPIQIFIAQAFVLWLMLFFPGAAIGQRDFLFAILVTPYVLAVALRVTSGEVRAPFSIAIGLLAAVGVGLKPPLIFGLVGVELVSLWRTRRIFYPEATALAVALVIYVGSVFAFFPLYIQLMSGWATDLYFAYSSMPGYTYNTISVLLLAIIIVLLSRSMNSVQSAWNGFGLVLSATAVILMIAFVYFFVRVAAVVPVAAIIAAVTLAIIFVLGPALASSAVDLKARAPAAPTTLIAAAAGCFIGYLVQWKGWPYQALPSHYFAAFALFSTCGSVSGAFWVKMRHAAVLALPLGASAVVVPILRQPLAWQLNQDILQATAGREGAFLVLSTDVHKAFPEAAQINHPWGLRFPCLILLPGLVRSEERNGGVIENRYRAAKGEFLAAITEDLKRYRPSVVMVPKGDDQALPVGFSALEWLLNDPAFAEEWAKYRESGDYKRYRVFLRHS